VPIYRSFEILILVRSSLAGSRKFWYRKTTARRTASGAFELTAESVMSSLALTTFSILLSTSCATVTPELSLCSSSDQQSQSGSENLSWNQSLSIALVLFSTHFVRPVFRVSQVGFNFSGIMVSTQTQSTCSLSCCQLHQAAVAVPYPVSIWPVELVKV